MWLIDIKGFPIAMAIAFAVVFPTNNEDASPGPAVAPIASMLSIATPEFFKAISISGLKCSEWFLLANSGTTPPNSRWMSIWDYISYDSILHQKL